MPRSRKPPIYRINRVTRSKAAENEKLPIYCATKSKVTQYAFNDNKFENAIVKIPFDHQHAILKAAISKDNCNGLLKKREELPYYRIRNMKPKDIEDINFATATITFLYTDTTTEEGYLGEQVEQQTFSWVRLNNQYQCGDRILNCTDIYEENRQDIEYAPIRARDKAIRHKGFNNLLTQRVSSFWNVSHNYDLPITPIIVSPADLEEKIQGSMFHEYFHHSEQGIMHHISSLAGLKLLLDSVLAAKAAYLYGIILDVYTQRMLCVNCNASLLGLQYSHQQGFLYDLTKKLKENRIETRTNGNLMLSTRVSASRPSKGSSLEPLRLPTDKDRCIEYNPDLNNVVLQAKNEELETREIINKYGYGLDSYRGTFFVSKTFKKVNLEDSIHVPLVSHQQPG